MPASVSVTGAAISQIPPLYRMLSFSCLPTAFGSHKEQGYGLIDWAIGSGPQADKAGGSGGHMNYSILRGLHLLYIYGRDHISEQ